METFATVGCQSRESRQHGTIVSEEISRTGSRTLFRNDRMHLAQERYATPDGPVVRSVIHHPGSVVIVGQTDPDHVVLVRQYRYPVASWTLEVPAGTLAPGEDPTACATRELAEEAGFHPRHLIERIRFWPAVGLMDEDMIVYEARGLEPAVAERDHGELIEPAVVPLADLPRLRAEGVIRDAKTLIALQVIFPDCGILAC